MKVKYHFECMDCGKEWEQQMDQKKFEKQLELGDMSEVGDDGMCPRCGSADIVITKDDKVFNGKVFEVREAKLKILMSKNSGKADYSAELKKFANYIKKQKLSELEIANLLSQLKKELLG